LVKVVVTLLVLPNDVCALIWCADVTLRPAICPFPCGWEGVISEFQSGAGLDGWREVCLWAIG
jgi:hypothetical protein